MHPPAAANATAQAAADSRIVCFPFPAVALTLAPLLLYPLQVSAESRAAVLEFIERRLEQLLADGGVQIEAVRTALRERGRNAALASRTAREIAVRRCVRCAGGQPKAPK